MEIIYLSANGYHPFKICSFNLSGSFNVVSNVFEDEKSIQIRIEENKGFPPHFYGKQISNLSAIIGKNGAGKTRLLDLLIGITKPKSSWYSLPPYFVIFFDRKRKEFYLRHNLFELDEDNELMQPRMGEAKYKFDLIAPEGYSFSGQQNRRKSQTVYYSPMLDLSNFPTMIDSKDYVDVSLDFLLIDDDRNPNSDYQSLAIHRFKNVERQFGFVNKFRNNNELIDKFPLPKKLDLHSKKSKYDKHWDNDLSYSAQEIRKYFLGNQTPENRGVLSKGIIRLQHILRKAKDDSRAKAQLNLTRLTFLYDYVNHFFTSMNSQGDQYDLEINVEVKEFTGMDPWQAFEYFLSKQAWTSDGGSAGSKLIKTLWELFQKDETKVNEYFENRAIFTKDHDIILSILRAHKNYIESLPTYDGLHSVPELLQINWRNLSSGEKSFLDIFSRLLYAFESIQDKDIESFTRKIKERTDWVYLFIDEGEIGFHPEWQRQYVRLLVDLIPIIFQRMEVQVFITSHSPFVLSDLPSQNVVFIEKNEEGLSIVRDNIDLKNTFASNIHTLLADGFFMSKGLVGAFAKEKVNKIIKWINEGDDVSTVRIEEIKNSINLIGEPMVRRKLLESFNNKLGIDGALEQIEDELRELNEKKQILIKNKKNA